MPKTITKAQPSLVRTARPKSGNGKARAPPAESVNVHVNDELLDAELSALAREILGSDHLLDGDTPAPKTTQSAAKKNAKTAPPRRVRRI